MTRRTFALSLGMIAIASLMCRLGYVGWQAIHEPAFARPGLDGAIYVDWGRGLLSGQGEPPGAFYLAPLYPHVLAAFFASLGESWRLLYVMQHVMVVGAACFLGLSSVARIGEGGALLAATMASLYHPAAFFASRPIGEPLALMLVAIGVYLYSRSSSGSAALAGLALGLATLARPNLLLIAAGLAVVELAGRRYSRASVLIAASIVVLAPVTVRNLAASGHPVLVSSNGGMTLYHGNGPGALGIFTPAEGFSGVSARQRDEATILARVRAGERFDPVEADRWWGRQALRARVSDPLGSIALVTRKLALTIDDYEHGLDDAPALDGNPWRRAFPVRFSVVIGLAAVAVAALGLAGSGGAAFWVPVAAAAVTPVAFYVSSRYRLPMAWLLCIPAGAGAAIVLRAVLTRGREGGWRAVAAGAAVALCSLLVPSGSLARTEESAAHANRASTWAESGDFSRAETEARKALELDPSSVSGSFNLGVILTAGGRTEEAEAAYRRALAHDSSHAESAGNLAKLLVERGAAHEAVPILVRALASRPGDALCWTNLVAAHLAMDDRAAARRALDEGERAGVAFAPELAEAVRESER